MSAPTTSTETARAATISEEIITPPPHTRFIVRSSEWPTPLIVFGFGAITGDPYVVTERGARLASDVVTDPVVFAAPVAIGVLDRPAAELTDPSARGHDLTSDVGYVLTTAATWLPIKEDVESSVAVFKRPTREVYFGEPVVDSAAATS